MQITQEEIAELEPWDANISVHIDSPRMNYRIESISASQEFEYLKNEEESLGRPEALKRLTSKINSYISRYKSKFLNATDTSSSYDVLTIILRNKNNRKLEKVKTFFPRFKFVAGNKFDFNVVEPLYRKEILSNFQEYNESLKELSRTNLLFFFETVIKYTAPLFEQNPDIDFIANLGRNVYFGKTVKELDNEQLTVFWIQKFYVRPMTFIDSFTINREKLFYNGSTRLEEKHKKSDFVTPEALLNIILYKLYT